VDPQKTMKSKISGFSGVEQVNLMKIIQEDCVEVYSLMEF
jgi:hypothetical protein